MARPATSARRYAEAAFELASADGSHEQWARDLEIAAALAADERIATVLDNPSIPHQERLKVVDQMLGSHVAAASLSLVKLLVGRGRAELLPQTAVEYRRLVNRQRGIVEAVVTTALPLTTDETEAIRVRIEAMARARIDLRTRIDESLIGGLTVTVGDRLLDASVRGRLERLRDELLAGTRTG